MQTLWSEDHSAGILQATGRAGPAAYFPWDGGGRVEEVWAPPHV